MVNLSELSPFAMACGLKAPIDLRIVRNDGTVLAEGELDLPCALAGRDPVCEVTLLDGAISLRHACLQAVGGRVLVADIGSRTGLHQTELELAAGPDRQPFLWLTPTDPVAVGPFRISLRKPLFVRPSIPESSPFLPDAATVARLPRVAVRFLNGKTVKGEWVVNRVVTFVGRARDCKISLAADDIDPFHCYFVLTEDGLWVVDLLSREGIRINGEAVRYAHLKTGDFLQVGRFRLGFEYLEDVVANVAPSSRKAERTPSSPLPLPQLAPRKPTTPHPELVPVAASDDAIALASLAPAANPEASPPPVRLDPEPELGPLIESFSAAQGQMLEQFQASILRLLTAVEAMHREQMTAMQAELAQMAELNAEMQRLQSQLATVNLAPPAAHEGRQRWAYERLAALQAERQTLWQRLLGMMAPISV